MFQAVSFQEEENEEKVSDEVISLPSTIKEIDLSFSKVTSRIYEEIVAYQNLERLVIKNCKTIPKTISIPSTLTLVGQETDSYAIDSRTQPDSGDLHATRIFKPKPRGPKIYVIEYRNKAFTKYNKETGTASLFNHPADYREVTDIKVSSKVIERYADEYEYKPNHFLGKLVFPKGKDKIRLVSLTPDDELVGIELLGPNGPYGLYGRTVHYCSNDNFYYLSIGRSCNEDLKVFYILKSPYGQTPTFSLITELYYELPGILFPSHTLKSLKFTETGRLNEEFLYKLDDATKLRLVRDYFEGFESKELSRETDTIKETVNLILEERAGACRHGALAMFAVLQELGIDSSLIENKVHMYVETRSRGEAIKIHSGGSVNSKVLADDPESWPLESNDKSESNRPASFLEALNMLLKYPKKFIDALITPESSDEFSISETIKSAFLSAVFIIKYPFKFISEMPTIIANELRSLTVFKLTVAALAGVSLGAIFTQIGKINKFLDNLLDSVKSPSAPDLSSLTSKLNEAKAQFSEGFSSAREALSDYSVPEEYMLNLNNVLLVLAAAGSTSLMLVAAKYFYALEKKKLSKLLSEDYLEDPESDDEVLEESFAISTDEDEQEEQKIEAIEADNKAQELSSSTVPSKPNYIELPLPETNPFIDEIKNQLSEAKSMEEFVREVLILAAELKRKNVLCQITKSQIEGFYQSMLALNEDVYFISNLDSISLEDSVVVGQTIVQIDSKLAHFIKSGKGILVVDWTEYRSSHIGFNSIIDKDRRVYKLQISPEILVISIADEQMGNDFNSRQKLIRKLSPSVSSEIISMPETIECSTDQIEIPFYSEDWQYYLFGRIKLNEEGYIYKTPQILEHLEQGIRNIVLRNAPWNNREFRLAIKDIENSGKIYINGIVYDFQGIRFIRNDAPFSLDGLELVEPRNEEYQMVTKDTFFDIFERYEVKGQKLVIHDDHLTNTLLIAENLSPGQWAQLASINAKIVISQYVDNAPFSPNFVSIVGSKGKIIISNDFGISKRKYLGKKIIHIGSETAASDLIDQMDYDSSTKIFDHDFSALSELLLIGEDVVLVGTISESLARQLSSLFIDQPYMMINGHRTPFLGAVTLITTENKALQVFKKEVQLFSTEEVWREIYSAYGEGMTQTIAQLEHLVGRFNQLISKPVSFSYDQISSILHRMSLKQESNPLKHILRLHPDYPSLKPHLEAIWPKRSEGVKPTKLEKLLKELSISPIVFEVGPSGAGKTTFMHSQDINDRYEVLEGLDNLGKLTSKSPDGKPRLLFLDEANMVARPDIYEILYGLFMESREVLVDRKLKPFDPDSGIVMVGNYRYFRNRKDIKIINSHGSIISIKELGDETLTSKITSLLTQLLPEEIEHFDQVSRLFIESYRHINSIFPNRELLTPRNLEMMSLRYVKLFQDKIGSSQLIAALSIYDEVTGMLSKPERIEFRKWLEEKTTIASIKNAKAALKDNFGIDDIFVPGSWKNSLRLMDYQLKIRELKIKYREIAEANAICALLFEGEAGDGKSYRIIKFLESRGFKDAAQYPDAENKYHLITPTDYSAAEEILSYGADEGDVIVIDEFNTMPLENPLNRLLSGYKLSGERLESRGLTVFATQNPVTYDKRLGLSDALIKRLQLITTKNLNKEELIDLVRNLSDERVSPVWIETIVDFYLGAIDFANKEKLPVYNLRHLTEYVEEKKGDLIKLIEEQDSIITDYIPVTVVSSASAPKAEALSYAALASEAASDSTGRIIEDAAALYKDNTNTAIIRTNIDQELNPEAKYISYLDRLKILVERYSNTIDQSIKGFMDSQYRALLFKYLYWNNQDVIAVQKILAKPYVKGSSLETVRLVLEKPIHEWKKSDFKKVKLALHPDKFKGLSDEQKSGLTPDEMNQDFITLGRCEETLDPSNLVNGLRTKIARDFDYSAELHTLNFIAKEVDIAADAIKLYFEPNTQNTMNLARDSLMLANKVFQDSKLGYVLPIFSSIVVIQDIWSENYWKAGINAIHGFSHHLINNPLFFGYGAPIYTILNGATIVSDIYQGKYATAAIQTAGLAALFVAPTLTASIYAVSYTVQNTYEAYLVYQKASHKKAQPSAPEINREIQTGSKNQLPITYLPIEIGSSEDDYAEYKKLLDLLGEDEYNNLDLDVI